ncbi:MAG: hypothetical protein HUM72_24850 [Dolichospermum sp.]|nr:hypothetical protein [Dolichospermum sp.]
MSTYSNNAVGVFKIQFDGFAAADVIQNAPWYKPNAPAIQMIILGWRSTFDAFDLDSFSDNSYSERNG